MDTTVTNQSKYPASLSVDYPERDHDRLTILFRLFMVIPILAVMCLVIGPTYRHGTDGGGGVSFARAMGGLVVLPTMLMLIFRQKYPRWWFEWNLSLARFISRVSAYLTLLRDEYPSTDEDQSVHLEIAYPDAKVDLNRWMALIKWFLAIPHYVALAFLHVAAFVCVVIAWYAILLTGRYPRSLFDFVVGVMRWTLRVGAYALLLTTDRYPPFQLGE